MDLPITYLPAVELLPKRLMQLRNLVNNLINGIPHYNRSLTSGKHITTGCRRISRRVQRCCTKSSSRAQLQRTVRWQDALMSTQHVGASPGGCGKSVACGDCFTISGATNASPATVAPACAKKCLRLGESAQRQSSLFIFNLSPVWSAQLLLQINHSLSSAKVTSNAERHCLIFWNRITTT